MKTALIALGLYLASLALWFVLLIIGMIAAGSSHRGAENAMIVILGGLLAALVASCVLVLRRMKRANVSPWLRLLAGLAWSGLSVATMMALFMGTALIFNR